MLEGKYNAVHQLLKEAQEIQSSLSADNVALKFELANVNAELEKCQRQLQVSVLICLSFNNQLGQVGFSLLPELNWYHLGLSVSLKLCFILSRHL